MTEANDTEIRETEQWRGAAPREAVIPDSIAITFLELQNQQLRARVRELEAKPREEVRARVLAHWDYPPGWEHGSYTVITPEHIMRIRERNNVERPSFYGATIQELTSTCLFLYSVLRGTPIEECVDRVAPQLSEADESRTRTALDAEAES